MNGTSGRFDSTAKTVRSLLHRLGYRFRLRQGLTEGIEEMRLTRRHAVVEVIDCGRYSHPECRAQGRRHPPVPRTNDALRHREEELAAAGWRTIRVWSCEVDDAERLSELLDIELSGDLIAE
ncbi:MAG: hypothetical protein JXR77_00210 [Lentisphaeria bacterium]|nr:hypothetical protein [Lentisphaeria bacterium]